MSGLSAVSEVVAALSASRCEPAHRNPPRTSGVYALYLRVGTDIAGFPVATDGLVYIGKGKNLHARDIMTHFGTGKTGSSTVRRTLGALLKDKLCLTAISRSPTAKPEKYKFTADGEERLTAWMLANLEIGICEVVGDFRAIEKALIRKLEPVLNLTDWPNPYRGAIRRMWAVCADEALRSL